MFRMLIGISLIAGLLMGWSTDTAASYRASILAWQKHREEGLRKPDSWLTLAGLFWLKKGNNSIGSAASNDFVLEGVDAPARIGRLQLNGDQVTFVSSGASGIKVNGKAISGEVALHYGEEQNDLVEAGTISFFVLKRSDRIGLRAKDSASKVRKNFRGLQYFAIDSSWHVAGRLRSDPKKIPILNILGQTEMQDSPGVVEFLHDGQTFQLRPIYEGKTLFFLFKDQTNKTETYQAGRMLNTPLPRDGQVDLDFNKSYNPPCTFTPYATCPLPPKSNTITAPVKAGEKRYGRGNSEDGRT